MSRALRSLRFFLVVLLAAMVFGVGCGSAETRTVPARTGTVPAQTRTVSEHTASGPLVSYERTGGIAGLDDSVVVSATGAVTVRHRNGVRHHSRLTARRLRALRRALAAAHFERPVSPGTTGCADCFSFRLTHGGHTLSFSQLATPRRLNGVLRILTPLAERS